MRQVLCRTGEAASHDGERRAGFLGKKRAVNLGEDTDTTAAVAGGLAGLYYGEESIPTEWLDVLARREDIRYMCDTFADVLADE